MSTKQSKDEQPADPKKMAEVLGGIAESGRSIAEKAAVAATTPDPKNAERPTHITDEEKAAAPDWPGKPAPGEPPVEQPPQVEARLEAEEKGGAKPPKHKKAHEEHKPTAADKKWIDEREDRRKATAHKPVHWKDLKPPKEKRPSHSKGEE